MIVAYLMSMAAAAEPMVAPPPVVTPVPVVAPPPVYVPGPPLPRPVATSDPRAKSYVAALFTTDDYPMSAIRNGEQGTVQADLLIGPDGRVSGCTIMSSSGSATLDNATCNIIRRRARFIPARDKNGNPTSDHYEVKIRWELPDDSPRPFSQMHIRVVSLINTDGSLTSCRASFLTPTINEGVDCSGFDSLRQLGNLTAMGAKPGDEVVVEIGFEPNESGPKSAIGKGPGEVLLMMRAGLMTVGPDGNIQSCTSTQSEGQMLPSKQFCDNGTPVPGPYEPLAAGSPSKPRNARGFVAVYLRRSMSPN